MANLILKEQKELNGDRLYRYTIGNYEVTKIDKALGYTIIDIDRKTRDRYTPEIYARTSWDSEQPEAFEVQTTSYGALAGEELQKVIAGLQEAAEVAEALTAKFIRKEETK